MPNPSQLPPVMKNGVSPSKLYLPKTGEHFASLLDYLCYKFTHIDRATWQERFRQGLVLDETGLALDVCTNYQHGRTIYYYRQLPQEIVVPFEHQIIFENEAILVVDKPHFLAVTPTGQYVQQSLLVRLKNQTGYEQLTPVHRLDRETAGLILFTKSSQYRATYQTLFATQQIYKQYHAIAPINPQLKLPCELNLRLVRGEPFYTMAVAAGETNSQTKIELLSVSDDEKLGCYLLTPTTGKLHQLRVHLNHLGIAIVNDGFYPQVRHQPAGDFSAPLQLLAKRLSFKDPITGEMMCFQSVRRLAWENKFRTTTF